MATSAAASAVRRAVSNAAAPAPAASGAWQFHPSGATRYSNDYIVSMKNRKLKMGLGVFGSLAIGIMMPIWAVQFQTKKSGSAS